MKNHMKHIPLTSKHHPATLVNKVQEKYWETIC